MSNPPPNRADFNPSEGPRGMLYLYVLAMVQSRVGEPEAAMVTLNRLYELPGF